MKTQEISPFNESEKALMRKKEVVKYLTNCSEIMEALCNDNSEGVLAGREVKLNLANDSIYNTLMGQLVGGVYNISVNLEKVAAIKTTRGSLKNFEKYMNGGFKIIDDEIPKFVARCFDDNGGAHSMKVCEYPRDKGRFNRSNQMEHVSLYGSKKDGRVEIGYAISRSNGKGKAKDKGKNPIYVAQLPQLQ
jgi:hypothetical protein